MTREQFIDYLVEREVPFEDASLTVPGYDGIYVSGKKEYEMKRAHPRKYKDLFIPYIRVSHFDEPAWYTRVNGWVSYMTEKDVLDYVEKLARV